ncbi:MAG: CBS domain-containing protein [Geminicoccaceae bacterium]
MPTRLVREIIDRESLLTLAPSDTVRAAAKLMDETQSGSVAVVERRGRLVGILTERDIVRRVVAAGLDPQTTKLGDVMTEDPDAVTPETTVEDVVRRMHEFRYRYVPVVEHGRVIAVVSLRDVPIDVLSGLSGEIDARQGLIERIW